MNQAQLRYFKEVLGVEQILRGPVLVPETVVGPRLAIFVEKMNASQRELFQKMLAALKVEPSDILVSEDPKLDEYQRALREKPVVNLVFGFDLARRLEIEHARGKFSNQSGVATIVTHGPVDLSNSPGLKAEAWKDMKLAIQRLGIS